MSGSQRRRERVELPRRPGHTLAPARFGAALSLVTLLICPPAYSSGFPPFAFDDRATVANGGTVSVLNSGAASVLANDFDFERDPLIAFLEDDVDNGTLILNPNGTFQYTHDGGSATADRFTYRAYDGTRFSRLAQVRITILEAPGPPVITGQRNIATNEDEPRRIRLRDLFIAGGNGDLELWVGEGANYSVQGDTVIPDRDFNGTVRPPVRVTDEDNVDSNTFILDVVVRPVNDPPFVVGSVPDQVAQEEEYFELPLAQYFGDIDTGDNLVFSAVGLPPSRSLTINRSTGLLSGTPQLADAQELPFDITITAEDDGRATVSLSFRLTVFPTNRADVELSLSVQPNPAMVGNTPLWEIKVENVGTGAFDGGTLTAAWFSSEGPISLSPTGTGCALTGDGTPEPELVCPIGVLVALASNSFLVQSTHDAAGDTHLLAWVTGDDSQPENNVAALSLNLAASFSEGPAQNLTVSASDVKSADLNGDGLLDLVVASEDLQVYMNTGERELATPGVILGPGGEGAIVTPIDWNNDGMSDVAIARSDNRAGDLYLNDGLGGFLPPVTLPVTNVSAMASADLDGDGQSELVVSGVGGTELVRNDGQGQVRISFVHSTVARDVSKGDLDLDGLSDLILTDRDTRSIHVLLNDGNGDSFTESRLETGSVSSVNTADVDGDGVVDLLVAVDDADLNVPVSHVLRNQLNGSFVNWAQVGASPTAHLFAGDVSADGFIDLIAVNETGVHQIYLGNGFGDFVLDAEQILSQSAPLGHLVDINNDSFLDLILAGRSAGSVGIHANNGRGRFGLGDRTAPIIALIGEESMRIDVGAAFVDPGATANDDIDGDVTDQIVVDNPVNSSLVGSYSVTYAVTDHAGNLGQAVRTVRVGNVAQGGGGGGSTGSLFAALLVAVLAWRRRYSRKG